MKLWIGRFGKRGMEDSRRKLKILSVVFEKNFLEWLLVMAGCTLCRNNCYEYGIWYLESIINLKLWKVRKLLSKYSINSSKWSKFRWTVVTAEMWLLKNYQKLK